MDVSLSNPIRVMHFTLNLDGTPGDRRIDAVFRIINLPTPDRRVVVFEGFGPALLQTLHHEPAIVRVAPAPGVLVAGALGGVCAALRRRRGGVDRGSWACRARSRDDRRGEGR